MYLQNEGYSDKFYYSLILPITPLYLPPRHYPICPSDSLKDLRKYGCDRLIINATEIQSPKCLPPRTQGDKVPQTVQLLWRLEQIKRKWAVSSVDQVNLRL